MKRRDVIKQLNGFLLGLGTQPIIEKLKIGKKMLFTDEIIEFAKSKNIKYIIDNLGHDKYSKDFGKIYQAIPRVILLPVSVQQLKEVVVFANTKKIPLTTRGAAHSSSGQSLVAVNGVSIDLREFTKINAIQHENGTATLSCSPGVTLGQLNKFALSSNFVLPVQPFFPELTVGGILAAGGIGSSSHMHGLMISNVIELEVLTGNGSLIICDRLRDPEIFNSVLGTFGCLGIITNVKLRLVEAKKTFRVLRLVYQDIDEWLSDYHRLLKTTDISHLQGIMIRTGPDQSVWNFLLEVSLPFDSQNELKKYDEVISSLKYKNQLPSSDLNHEAFLNRYQNRFDEMRKSGKYDQSHPFLEFIIPADKAKDLIQQAFKILPVTYEDGFRLIFIKKKDLPSYFIIPPAENICMFAILPAGIHKDNLPECLIAADKLHDYALSMGATRYLSGWLGMMNSRDLKDHYGDKAAELVQLKKKTDPNNVLQSHFFEKLCDWMK